MLSQSATVIIIIIIIIIITIIIIVISLRSGLMLFPGKKCHNSGHQPVVLGIVAFFFLSFFKFFSFYIQHFSYYSRRSK